MKTSTFPSNNRAAHKYALLSDIHGNIEALEAVIQDAQDQHCDRFVCIGDIVGYN